MAVIYLGLGSNLGDREQNIQDAVRLLKEHGVRIEKASHVIETEPVGGVVQGRFLNAVLKATTHLTPQELLALSQAIERRLGRVATVRNGPRTIDIDILLYDQQKITTQKLIIPHPRMLQRDFVMVPLKEIEPDLVRDLTLCESFLASPS